MRHVVGFTRTLALLAVRICFGLLLVTHAWHRWGQAGMPAQAAVLAAHHVAQPSLVAWGTVLLEAVGGLLLVFGLAVPLVALLVVVQNVLTIAWIKWPQGLLTASSGFELNLVQALLGVLLFSQGSGRAGLDALLFRRRRDDREVLDVPEVP